MRTLKNRLRVDLNLLPQSSCTTCILPGARRRKGILLSDIRILFSFFFLAVEDDCRTAMKVFLQNIIQQCYGNVYKVRLVVLVFGGDFCCTRPFPFKLVQSPLLVSSDDKKEKFFAKSAQKSLLRRPKKKSMFGKGTTRRKVQ